ncbi:MAG TPA: prephenate dehydrogenase/arogenate dehydrogenase family protein [Gammaproteobacteria bacterium]|nr:prephenate dehydrogenase/arogenate dehydrogenase family protein [Gammaproteobacteria bacterium]
MSESFGRLAILGVGLIGGSLARALRARGAVARVVGCGRDRANLERAVELGVIDEWTQDPAAAAADADLVVVAVTLGATADILARIAPALAARAIVTDVGSAKRCVIDAARAQLPPPHYARFVAGHPIAGAEKSGVEAAKADLYERHRVILTPTADTDRAALATVRRMWERVGAEVCDMDAELHDEVLAATSHLPHLLAYALVDCLLDLDAPVDVFDFAAGGFRDFTRIASSSPAMWRDIAIENRAALLAVCARFEHTLARLRRALEAGDAAALEAAFGRAKAARDDFMRRRKT